MNVKSARKYRHADRLPSESWTPRTWRTREDLFQDVWPQLRDLLERNPELEAKTLFDDLQRRFPGRFADIQLRQKRASPGWGTSGCSLYSGSLNLSPRNERGVKSKTNAQHMQA
jgi:hypothetical protein